VFVNSKYNFGKSAFDKFVSDFVCYFYYGGTQL